MYKLRVYIIISLYFFCNVTVFMGLKCLVKFGTDQPNFKITIFRRFSKNYTKSMKLLQSILILGYNFLPIRWILGLSEVETPSKLKS